MAGSSSAVKVLASGMGLGYLPLLPGTWGTLGAALVYCLLYSLLPGAWVPALVALAAGTLAVGLLLYPFAQAAFGGRDPRRFVLDEMVGLWLTCLLSQWRGPVQTAVAAFFAFRLFDGAKPFPLRHLEKLPGGWGVMADDVGAALYSALALWAVRWVVLDQPGSWL